MQEQIDWHAARALLEWHIELGATEAIAEAPVDRFALPAQGVGTVAAHRRDRDPAPATSAREGSAREGPSEDPVEAARNAAAAAGDLESLRAALATFEHCELRKGARNLVFSDGLPGARVMIIGEAPGREEDQRGAPFVGRAGQLLDRMFAAIGLARTDGDPASALYITNMLPWRPPQNRDPTPQELAMMRPFVERHVALAQPRVLVLMGRISAGALLSTREGITRLRGSWHEALGLPVMPMLHPAYLLRNPAAKRSAWADLLALQARLREFS